MLLGHPTSVCCGFHFINWALNTIRFWLLLHRFLCHDCHSISCRQDSVEDQRFMAGLIFPFFFCYCAEYHLVPKMPAYGGEVARLYVVTSSTFPCSMSCVGVVFKNGTLLSAGVRATYSIGNSLSCLQIS